MTNLEGQRGFTLTELLVTIAIVGGLTAMGYSALASDDPMAIANDARSDTAVAYTTRSGIITDGTTGAAVLAGLPPDARGVIDADGLNCQTHPGSPLCEGRTISNLPYIRLTTKTLRASGVLETVRHVDVQQYGPGGDTDFTMVSAWISRQFFATPSDAYAAPLIPGQTGVWIDVSPAFETSYISLINHTTTGANLGNTWRSLCYANGTCEPTTFLFVVQKGHYCATKGVSFLSISMTGSIVTSSETFGC